VLSTGTGAELEDTVGVGTATGSPRSFMNIVSEPTSGSEIRVLYRLGIIERGRGKAFGFLVARHKVLNSPGICLKAFSKRRRNPNLRANPNLSEYFTRKWLRTTPLIPTCMARNWDRYSRQGIDLAFTATSLGFSAAKTSTKLGVCQY
jgi:hypothetical protein